MAGGPNELKKAVALLALLCLTGRAHIGEAIWLTIPSSGTKCVSEEIQSNVVVLADYYIVDDDHAHLRSSTISSRVTSPYGDNLHHNENVTHDQFAFTTTVSGNYVACFWINGQHQEGAGLTIGLDWKIGIAAKYWDSGVELELRKLEGAVEAIHNNLIYLKNREADMREISEITNARVAWFSIMSLGVSIIVSVFQLWYLRRYFQKKKLI
ncbi:hypothetical protein CDL15_Pgr006484 [Punica granatum]|uniref:GOLD domain-containing protein n=1 Tax=Punica granatum TaxID=22663 RepID=A0A218XYS6_PUNGR|nr:hypothetical protein CDL15_Pgr006484 [Punica granatum]PKI77665.1 hypothetical protein CRG98_001948 [Punica granatum]